jgi:prolyl-tRNA synthetase
VGIPFRINVGKKLAEGKVEVITRSTRASRDVMIAEVTAVVSELVRSAS